MVSSEETTPPAKSPPASMILAPSPEITPPEATPPEIPPPQASAPEAPPEAPLTSDQPPGSQAAGYPKAQSVDGGKLNSGSPNENGSQRGDESGNEGSSRFSLTCYEILDTEDEGSEPEDPNRKRPFSEAFAGGESSDGIAPNIIPNSANVTNRTIGVNESQSGDGNGNEGSLDALDYYYARDYEYGYQKELNDLRRILYQQIIH
ncbi:uncharacterized protein A4U43_C07F38510 [Asparagus officinalis]|uniref:Uncharacterized protein n=1 Tax=Asparagus officinalis TaxID=4686 RepID=A0A5P1EI78_ASPOF|nr:uncharacterized protein A4U43_C07F38510 [Asparagus officinalis]